MNLANQKILVTGADGFIGSHLVEGLLDKGVRFGPLCIITPSKVGVGWIRYPKDKLDKLDVFAGDIRDPNGVRKVMFQNSSFFKGDARRGMGLQELSSPRS